MQFGWLALSLSPSPDEDAQRIDNLIDQACSAERLGFSDVWLTEHYFTGESVYSDSLMFAAALAMKTQRIRIGFAVVQMPFHHPVRLAVQLALLDNLSKGRIDVGVGKGTVYNEYEFVGHGLRSTDSRERMEEAVDIIERAWREAPLSYDGRFHKVHIPAIRPRPVQQPGPPLWRSVISPGTRRPIISPPLERVHGWLYESLEDLVPLAKQAGKRLLFENTPYCFTPTIDELASVIRTVDDDALKIVYDVANAAYIGEDPVAALNSYHESIRLIHISDTGTETWGHDPIGTGVIDWEDLGRAVKSTLGVDNVVLEIIREENTLDEFAQAMHDLRDAGWDLGT